MGDNQVITTLETAVSGASHASQILTQGAKLWSILCGTDGTTDFQIMMYNGDANTKPQLIPKTPIDASVYGFNGVVFTKPKEFPDGVYLEVQAVGGGAFGGDCEITIDYEKAF